MWFWKQKPWDQPLWLKLHNTPVTVKGSYQTGKEKKEKKERRKKKKRIVSLNDVN